MDADEPSSKDPAEADEASNPNSSDHEYHDWVEANRPAKQGNFAFILLIQIENVYCIYSVYKI